MSRIGRKPIPVPQGVEVKVEGTTVTVKGPKGSLTREFHPDMKITFDGSQILVERPSDEKEHKALHGLTRTLINNMIIGVTNGYQKSLELVGVGYRAAKQGRKLVLMVGYSHPVEMDPPEGIEIEVPAQNQIIVKGIDKELVGNFAATIRAVREPEPYKGKGIKYTDEVIRRKAGKTGGKGKK
ncbi:50S ribosomal protein L6 [Carboxydothermus ferrireducens]|uniref:Large ribosomal subunit protein uL6 n=1 Tax=Carboxydothermus ferrireducens DSM 11255 TaxID=1119529 RepID=A0ABX2RDI6_9THEO|nr:50S ribosomal protein L6 [Carboxydothermus ferrireducens]NYE57957.1 large subunit ribosomal protein L6 [Carboxydothermus ferrireducens DSM 11255]